MNERPSLDMNRLRKSHAVLYMGWFLLIGVLFWTSLNIPRFSGQVPERGVVQHPRFFPYYFQGNIDAPLELSTAIGFPEYYQVAPHRVNRPVFYALIAGLRESLASPLVTLIAGKDAGRQSWGAWTARDYLLTYAIWMAVNLAFLLACASMYHRLVRSHFDSLTATLSVILMLSSPIVLLSLREIHLGVYHLLVGVACLAFWHAVLLGVPFTAGAQSAPAADLVTDLTADPAADLGNRTVTRVPDLDTFGSQGRNPLSRGGLFLASLGIGVLFLGKFCFNGFALGLALCILMGQARKLVWILPAVVLPTLAWILAAKVLGYAYGVSEVRDFKAGVWILDVGSLYNFMREVGAFLILWCKCLGENVSLAHLPFAALGLISLWKKRSRGFLTVAGLALLADMGFYFLLHRMNANYVMNSLLFFFIAVAEGLQLSLVAIGSRWTLLRRGRISALLALAILLAIQLALNIRQLPHYSG